MNMFGKNTVNDFNVQEDLDVDGNANIDGDLTVIGDLIITGSLSGVNKIEDIDSSTSITTNATAETLIFKTNSNEVMRIDSVGNIGIGTNNPSSQLHLMNGSAPQLLLDNDTFGQNTIKFQSNRGSANVIGDVCWFNDDTTNTEIARMRINKSDAADGNGEFAFFTANGTTLTQNMTITNDGNVGIGAATNPTIDLAFGKNNTGIDRLSDIWISFKTSGVETINYNNLSVNLFGGITTTAEAGIIIRKAATASTNNIFTNYYRSATDASTGGIFEGDVRLNSSGNLTITQPSDMRLKENIIDYSNGYNKVKALRTVEYNWIDPQKKTEIGTIVGFIAQEVQVVIPKSVGTFTKDNIEYLNISQNEFIPFIWSATRTLIEKVEQLETANVSLLDIISGLNDRLTLLENV